MKSVFNLAILSVLFTGCYFGGPPPHTTVYYPESNKKVVIIEEHHDESSYVVTEVVYEMCDPDWEQDSAPYWHTPEFCTDYGPGHGYCCTWFDGIGIYGEECFSEWCFWEDVCSWEHNDDVCYYGY